MEGPPGRSLVGAITKAIPAPDMPGTSGTIANTNWVEKEKAGLLSWSELNKRRPRV